MTRTESVCMSNTHASHQYPSRTQVTKPERNSSGTSVSSDVTLSSLKVVDAEKGLTCTVVLEVGINEWDFRVSGIVRDAWNLSSRKRSTFKYSSLIFCTIIEVNCWYAC